MPGTSKASRPRVWRLVWHGMYEDQLFLRASALAFQTLSSWLPLTAIVLAVLASPAFEAHRERVLNSLAAALVPEISLPEPIREYGPSLMPDFSLPGDEAAAQQQMHEQLKDKVRATVVGISRNLGKISTFSFIVLVTIAVLLYQTAEQAFNVIWKARAGRSYLMKFAIVTAFIFWGPVFLVLSVWITEVLSGSVVLGGYVLPVLLTAAVFTAFYMLMPNARVRWTTAALAAVCAALVWELGKLGFLIYVNYALRMSRVYGSLGMVPMVFAWAYLSWLVILTGGELSYILQNYAGLAAGWEARRRQAQNGGVLADARREAAQLPALALAAAIEVARRFAAGPGPVGARPAELADALEVEAGVLAVPLQRLVEAGVLVQVVGGKSPEDAEPRYLPARDPAQLTLAAILSACRGPEVVFGRGPAWEKAKEVLARIQKHGEEVTGGANLAELLPAAPPPPGAAAARPALPGHQPKPK